MNEFWRRLLFLFRRARFDRELEEEIHFHLERLGNDRRRFGNVTLLKEVSREMWGWRALETLVQDLRFGARLLWRSPAFTAFAVATLALGIGANTAIFSMVHAVLLGPLPFREPERVVLVWEDLRKSGYARNPASPANYVHWRTQNKVFEDAAAIRNQTLNLTGAGEPVQLDANFVTANLFAVLGVRPVLGRVFHEEEDRPGGSRLALLSYRIWQQNFGADPALPGKTILLDNEKYTVVGVLPPGFHFPEEGDVWAPIALSSRAWSDRWDHYLRVVARLKPGVSLEQAQVELDGIARRMEQEYPDTNKETGVTLVPLRDELAGNLRAALAVLLAAVGCVLLIACSNVANLLLARASSRRREMAIRAALGAGRGRLVRQVLIESLLLASIGAVFGLLLAKWSFLYLRAMVPRSLAVMTELTLSMEVLLFTAVVALLTAVIFGIAPALRIATADVSQALKEGGRGGLSGGGRLRRSLVVAQVALACGLLIAAGLLIRTLARLRGVDLGFRPENVLTLRTALPRGSGSKYNDFAVRTAFYRDVLARVHSLPGVVAAGYITYLPLTNIGGGMPFLIEGRPAPPPGQPNLSFQRAISPNYLRAMGIPLRAGRLLADSDGPETPPVAVINEAMARRYWPDQGPIGKRFRLAGPDRPWVRVVGVVGDVKSWDLDQALQPEMYFTYQQSQGSWGYFAPRDLVIRTAGPPRGVAEAARREIRIVDKDQPVSDVRTLEEVIAAKLVQRQVQTGLLGAFAGLALLMAALGLYGVLAYAVTRRTQEIGVRMALGAGPREIVRSVLAEGMRLVLAGVTIGLAGALALGRLLRDLLFGVSSMDPLTFVLAPLVLVGVAMAACWFPARRAAKVDPMVALRYD